MKMMNKKYLNEKIAKEVSKIKVPLKARDFKGISASGNKKVEDDYFFIPNINMVELFNHFMMNHNIDNLPNKEALNKLFNFTLNNTICNKERCKNCREYCYNEKARFNMNNISSRFNRLLEYLENKESLKNKILYQLQDTNVLRLHTEGDFFDLDYINFWMDIIKKSKVKTYTYTKQYSLIREYIKSKKGLPAKFYLQVSFDNNNNINDLPIDILNNKRVNLYYTYEGDLLDDKKLQDITSLLGWEVLTCKGKCSKCRQCYTKSNKIIACKKH